MAHLAPVAVFSFKYPRWTERFIPVGNAQTESSHNNVRTFTGRVLRRTTTLGVGRTCTKGTYFTFGSYVP